MLNQMVLKGFEDDFYRADVLPGVKVNAMKVLKM